MRRFLFGWVLLLGVLWGVWMPKNVSATQRCFTETGFCIDGRIREYWDQNGGLPVFGYPIGPVERVVVSGKSVDAQRFERYRLELHPENARPYDVELGRLGAQYLLREFNLENGPSFGIAEKDISGAYLAYRDDCRWFVETQHYICGEFFYFWHNHGLRFDKNPSFSDAERIALFGLPITSFRRQTIDGKEFFVQIFERARFEYHPENAEPFKVQLGLLGREETTLAPAPAPTAVPSTSIGAPATDAAGPNILPEEDLKAFRYKMPTPGFWMTSSDGIVVSAGSFQYMRVLKDRTAPKGQKYVVFAISVKNTRTVSYRGEYINAAYFSLTDVDGGSRVLQPTTYALEGMFTGAYLSPGEQTGGQVAFLIPSNSAPAQLHIDFPGNPMTLELRTWPITQ